MGHLDERAADLRRAAQQCRDDARQLHHLRCTTAWTGVAAEACWLALSAHCRALEVLAHELDLAAAAVTVHARAAEAPAAPAVAVVHAAQKLLP